jgi:apolipoprotein N-acyltransferase
MRQMIRDHYPEFMLATLSGILLTLAFPKIDQGWLAWMALIPLFWALRDADVRTGWWLGFWSGLVHGLGVMYWTVYTMHVYGYIPLYQCIPLLILLSAYLALYPGLFAAAVSWLDHRPGRLLLFAPTAWTALEYLRTHLFTGFPWELLGYSQYDYPWVIQIADLVGVYGISALIVLVNAALTLLLLAARKRSWHNRPVGRWSVVPTLSIAITLAAAVALYGKVRLDQVDAATAAADKAHVAVVQGNIDQAIKWDPAFQMQTAEKYTALSLEIAPKADLIIWPETATPFYLFQDKTPTQVVVDGVKAAGKDFIIGSPFLVSATNGASYYNSAYLITPQGGIAGRYDKVHLVPFGEYVPLKRYLPFIKQMVALVGDFKTGEPGSTLPWNGHEIGMLICYEAIFPGLSRAMTQSGAHLLVNITNDAWFGFTSAAYQHFSMSVLRAVENRRVLARSANTGISGFIDAGGRIMTATALMQDATATAELALLDIPAFYTRWGDWPLASVMGVILAAGALRRYRLPATDHKKRVSG